MNVLECYASKLHPGYLDQICSKLFATNQSHIQEYSAKNLESFCDANDNYEILI